MSRRTWSLLLLAACGVATPDTAEPWVPEEGSYSQQTATSANAEWCPFLAAEDIAYLMQEVEVISWSDTVASIEPAAFGEPVSCDVNGSAFTCEDWVQDYGFSMYLTWALSGAFQAHTSFDLHLDLTYNCAPEETCDEVPVSLPCTDTLDMAFGPSR